MYDIKQFRPSLYLVIAIGFAGFGLAIDNYALLLLSLTVLLINWRLVRSGKFRSMPHWMANIITICGVAWTFYNFQPGPQAILSIGQFLLIMQIVKLFEQRNNRDYAQLLVLSLLLMVAAIINTSKLSVGLLMLIYLAISTYTCLLFHLKVETENARQQMGIDDRHLNPLTLRQDQKFLMRSMGRMTGLVGVASILVAVLVFLFFPRGIGANTFGMQLPSAQTGLSREASLQSAARVAQNHTEVAWLRIKRSNATVTQGPIYLRAFVFDHYQPSLRNWSEDNDGFRSEIIFPDPLYTLDVAQRDAPSQYVQEFIPLRPTGLPILLAMPGASKVDIDLNARNNLRHSLNNRVIRLTLQINRNIDYTVYSTGKMPVTESQKARSDRWLSTDIPPEITALARNPDVSGRDESGNALIDRITVGKPSDINSQVAKNIERWLQQNFNYSLDMSSVQTRDDPRDPIVAFLTDHRTGFCEYFASGMTLMCQSIGIPTRYVSGYKVDEFNEVGGYFIVRQSHAHAWVEVMTPDGWMTFDPTTSNGSSANNKSIVQTARHVVDYLQHLWSSYVVAYDASSQTSMLEKVENIRNNQIEAAMNPRKPDGTGWFDRLIDVFDRFVFRASGTITGMVAIVSILLVVGAAIYSTVQRIRLSRRADRIGLDVQDPQERRRLAQQLGFYDRMIRTLDRAGVRKPPHLTPLEFSQSLTFLPSESYDSIVRMTAIYYRLRYGRARLHDHGRRRLESIVEKLDMKIDRSI